jgi:hypothetical protein
MSGMAIPHIFEGENLKPIIVVYILPEILLLRV